jgi:hypothetical protein
VSEGQALRARSHEVPPPIAEVNDWIRRMTAYFEERKGRGYDVRLNDFSGMLFYGSQFERAIDARLRRLQEFLSEL